MKHFHVNVLSVTPQLTPAILATLAAKTRAADLVSTIDDRVVGYCAGFHVEGEDLWALAELDDEATWGGAHVHCESIVALGEGGPVLCAVALTNFPRGSLQDAPVGRGFIEAVKTSAKLALLVAGMKERG